MTARPAPRSFPAPSLRENSRSMLYRSAAAYLRGHVNGTTPDVAARALYGREHGLDPVLKAASSPATLTDPAWAGPAVQNLIRGDLIQQITALSAAAALMEACVKVDLSGIASITIPGRLYNPASAGAWVAEDTPIPVRTPQLTQGPKLQPRKLAVLSGYSREMIESSAIVDFTRMAIGEASAALLDQQMFSTNPGDAAHPPGILTGAVSVTPSTSTATWAISSDVGALVGALAQ
jgi:HK97 family phage major capsid protein